MAIDSNNFLWRQLLIVGIGFSIVPVAFSHITPELQQKQQVLVQKNLNNLIFVEGGEYNMGDFGQSVSGENNDPWQNSKPLHEVHVDSFSMSKHKISLRDYQLYLMLHGKAANEFDRSIYTLNRESDAKGSILWQWDEVYLPYQESIEADLPAFLYWREAEAYCQWLGQVTGLPFDLPTEAQWEYAARNRGQAVLYATDTGFIDEGRNVPTRAELDSYAYMENMGMLNFIWRLSGKTFQPMGQYPSTPLGFYDMVYHGWEWMKDFYGEHYYQHSPKDNPAGELLPTIWHSARGLEPRNKDYAPTTTRARFYTNYSFFPLGFTARCVVNGSEPIK